MELKDLMDEIDEDLIHDLIKERKLSFTDEQLETRMSPWLNHIEALVEILVAKTLNTLDLKAH